MKSKFSPLLYLCSAYDASRLVNVVVNGNEQKYKTSTKGEWVMPGAGGAGRLSLVSVADWYAQLSHA